MLHGDPTHGTATPAVETAKLGDEAPTEAPYLTTAEQSFGHMGRVYPAPEGPLEGEVAKHAPWDSKGRRR